MDRLEEIFLKKWGMKLEDIQTLLKRLEYVKQIENETLKDFQVRFEGLLYEIPRSHHPGDKYLVYLYTNALLVHLGFLLNKKEPKTIYDAYYMAKQIEENVSLSKGKHISSL
jgi:broad specificity phosphatase PhoE